MRRAVIDIGTNSVKLLVAEVKEAAIEPLWENNVQTRLGQGLYESGILQPDAIQRTLDAVCQFTEKAASLNARKPAIIATSAAREARNSTELGAAILAATGVNMRVLSGAEEAAWVFKGVISDARHAGHPLCVTDVGGGSAEFIVGDESEIYFQESYPLGTVRLFERRPLSDPPTTSELIECRNEIALFVADNIAPNLHAALRSVEIKKLRWAATGGTPAIIARMKYQLASFDREKIDGAKIETSEIKQWVDRLWSLPLAERKKVPGLPAKRADVMLMGVAIYESILECFGAKQIHVSARGLRYAALVDDSAAN